ncbi:MAG: class I SAM-dependent methyltransferase [Candidatus Blackburnbacteria bacterium]|nr:class I SAM-dependent methyltransferase [Candidatus Blackburnbacteria bacterium]
MGNLAVSVTYKRAVDLHQHVPPDWYARSIKENVLQWFWHTTRFKEVSGLIEKAGGRVLDIGCADGTFTKVVLSQSGASEVVGIDILPKSVAYAKRRFARSKKLSFRVADAHKLPFPSRSFDAVFCLETLEHVADPDMVISEIYRVLKDDGYAIILVPSENLIFRFAVWPLWTLWRGRIWKGTHIQNLSTKELLAKMDNGKFEIKEYKKFLLGMLQVIKVAKKQL